MTTTKTQMSKERIIETIEEINTLENKLLQNKLTFSFEEVEEKVENIHDSAFEMEWHVRTNKEALFYVRLLRAKCEEILDILALKRAM